LQPQAPPQTGLSDLIEALPPVLILHLGRFLDDAAVDGMVKNSKPVQFTPELEIPLGAIFSFCFPHASKG
jgi:hypothetical protein